MEYSDAELLNSIKSDSKRALQQIYDRYWKKMLAVAWNHCQDEEVAKDIVQEVFIDLWEKRQSKFIDQLSPYLATAVKFKIFSYYQKEQRRSSLAGQHYHFEDIHIDEQQLDAKFLQDLVNGILEKLPEKCRLVFHLSRNLGLSNTEIAAQTGTAKKTVENNLNRALKVIRRELGNRGIHIVLIISILYRK